MLLFIFVQFRRVRHEGVQSGLVVFCSAMVDPVTIWKNPTTKDVSPEDLQRLANDLWSKLRESLWKDYQIVYQPGPGVMRLAAAITEAEASNPAMDTISSLHPATKLLSGA